MKIAIDISQIVYKTGVSEYTKNLVRSLLKIDKNNEYLLFAGTLRQKKEIENFVDTLEGNFKTKTFPIPPMAADFLWNRAHKLYIENLIGRIDLVHTSDWSEPPSNALKVTTVHDLSPINFSHETHSRVKDVHSRKLSWVKKESRLVIVPSKSTMGELVEAGFNKKRIVVIPEANIHNIQKVSEKSVKNVKSKYEIVGDFVLMWGTSPRKNYERGIKAFEIVKDELKLSKIVILGHMSHNIDGNAVLTGRIPDAEVSALYSGAVALLYPSLNEGFGISILDAFNCDCPVVTSNISSMPEVAGDAAVLVDPYSVESIATGLKMAVKNRQNLIKKGRARVKQYSWERAAAKTLSAYEKLAKIRK